MKASVAVMIPATALYSEGMKMTDATIETIINSWARPHSIRCGSMRHLIRRIEPIKSKIVGRIKDNSITPAMTIWVCKEKANWVGQKCALGDHNTELESLFSKEY